VRYKINKSSKSKLLFTFLKEKIIIYGETIKKIREDKGLALKSVYIDVCSKTNAIKFEKGERL